MGYALLRDFDNSDLLPFAELFGEPKADTRNPAVIRDLRPQLTTTAATNTLSHRYGMGAFPMHTEAAYWREPARYVFLFCVTPGRGRRPTVLLDITPRLSSQEVALLATELWVVGRTRHPFIAPVLDFVRSRPRLRFDLECMKPAQRRSRSEVLLRRLVESEERVQIEWKRHDLLIIDNFRTLHGRGVADAPDPDRHLRRVLVSERTGA